MPRSPEGRMDNGGLSTCLCLLVSPSRDAPAWVSLYILAQIQMVEMNHTGTSSTAQICRQQEPPLLEWVCTICVVSGTMSYVFWPSYWYSLVKPFPSPWVWSVARGKGSFLPHSFQRCPGMVLPILSELKGLLLCEALRGNSAPNPKNLFWLKTGLISGQNCIKSKNLTIHQTL